MKFVPVIGLEVHLQLRTRTKIFCGCATDFGRPPNSQVCPVCLGLPGVLPVLNRKVLEFGIRVGLGLNGRVCPRGVFHRKNYFYPDLPKGYQISQFDLPLATDGYVEIPAGRRIRIHRVHMEEDAGKLIHDPKEGASLVDFNRAGVPLLEIVSEPDLTCPEEAQLYLRTLKGILQYLEVSDCDMEKGSLRCDANISLKPIPPRPSSTGGRQQERLGTKAEIKNMNSFRAVGRALAYEIERQTGILSRGGRLTQETRLWDDARGVTQGMRSKEYAHDYRYFPEPDLVPFTVSEEEIERISRSLPELPAARSARFVSGYGLSHSDAGLLTALRPTADYYEACLQAMGEAAKRPEARKRAAHWILGDLYAEMNVRHLDDIRALSFPPEHLAELMALIDSGKISGKMAKEVFAEALKRGQAPARVVEARGLSQVTDRTSLRQEAESVVAEHPKAVEDFARGKSQALMFLVGQLMRRTRGAASPALSQEILRELLKEKPS